MFCLFRLLLNFDCVDLKKKTENQIKTGLEAILNCETLQDTLVIDQQTGIVMVRTSIRIVLNIDTY